MYVPIKYCVNICAMCILFVNITQSSSFLYIGSKMPKIELDGYEYTKTDSRGESTYYRCSKYYGKGCTARLIIKNGTVTKLTGNHCCRTNEQTLHIVDVNTIKETVTRYSQDHTLSLSHVQQRVITDLRNDNPGRALQLPSKQLIRRLIREARGEVNPSVHGMFGGQLAHTNDGFPFLQSSRKFMVGGSAQEIAIWSSPEGKAVLRQNFLVLIDATFRITPHPFSQCVVVMALDRSTDTYVPCVWALMSSKNETMYWLLLQDIASILDWRWRPEIIVTDFEKSLVAAVKAQFPETRLVGCFFHFKQAIIRKLTVKFGFIRREASDIAGKFDFLTVLPNSDIQRGISYLQDLPEMQTIAHKEFFDYFHKTWMEKYGPEMWNISDLTTKTLVTRTNNPLERYNRRLNELFLAAHPTLARFVSIIRSEEADYSNLIRGIRSGSTSNSISREGYSFPEIPVDFCL